MKTQITPQEWEAISAYLDGQLAAKERSRLEARMQASTELRTAVDEMKRTRSLLRSQPKLRAPRNFTLSPQMAGVRQTPRSFPTFRLAAALATILLVFVVIGDFFTKAPVIPASQPQVAMQAQKSAASEAQPEVMNAAPVAPPGVGGGGGAGGSGQPGEGGEAPAVRMQGGAAESLALGNPEPTPAPNFAQASPAFDDQLSSSKTEGPLLTPMTWRIIEVTLLLVAVSMGLIALYLHRSS